jgi:hypothetical protein
MHLDITTNIVDDKAILDQGWLAFSVSHDLKVGYMLTFDKINTNEYYIAIFNYTCCKVVTKCPAHAKKFSRVIDEMEEE